MKDQRKISVLVADDHTIVRRGLVSLLSLHPRLEVVAEAANGRAAVEEARKKEPDVVLMDVGMPELNGLEATRQIRKYLPDTKILVLSGYDNESYVTEVLDSGANGYLLKSTAPEELHNAILAVCNGKKPLSTSLSPLVNDRDALDGNNHRVALTSREREVLQLIAEGNTHAKIAQLLHISVRTVDTHRNNILKKLDLHDAASLVSYAIRNGIVIIPK